MLRQTVFGALAIAVANTTTGASASAAGPGRCQSSGVHGMCWVEATDPGRPGSNSPGPAPQQDAGGKVGSAPICMPKEIPQPGTGDPMWAGRDPSKGRLVAMICGVGGPGGGYIGDVRVDYVPNGAEAPSVPQVSPAELAQRAISEMGLSAPDIRLAPPADSPHGATVGFPVWMWSGRNEATTGPVTRTASAGGITVSATATLASIRWAMGDGSIVTCFGPGTPFADEQAGRSSPTCGHVYRQKPPEGVFRIGATSHWEIRWSGGGQSASQAMDLTSGARLAVREIRTLNTRVRGG